MQEEKFAHIETWLQVDLSAHSNPKSAAAGIFDLTFTSMFCIDKHPKVV